LSGLLSVEQSEMLELGGIAFIYTESSVTTVGANANSGYAFGLCDYMPVLPETSSKIGWSRV
jgi:hypothetical protein